MKKLLIGLLLGTAAAACRAALGETTTLWQNGACGIAVYRIPALCTAPNGDLVAACDARTNHGGDLCFHQPINISIRRSKDGGKTWTDPKNSWTWEWKQGGSRWSGSDPSFVVDAQEKKIFLFYNVWEWQQVEANARAAGDKNLQNRSHGVYRFFVQESSDNGATWTKPREISKDIAIEGWPCGSEEGKGGFIFISSGSGIQTKDGTLLHTIVHVNDGNALFGSDDHGKTWKPFGKPVKNGDECKVVELSDGAWMINSRWRGGGRQIHVSKDRGMTWQSRYDKSLEDPQCNAQIMRYGKFLLFTNCKSPNRRALLHIRASLDDGQTWTEGVRLLPPDGPEGSGYSDMTILPNGDIGVLYEGPNYATIKFVTIPRNEAVAELFTK